jgi:predicted N-formylglutamate amidohydrolase
MPDALSELPVVISCEHAANAVPATFRHCFPAGGRVLQTHRGYDPGTAELGKRFARTLRCPSIAGRVTRLLVELNRSLHHPRLFSEFAAQLTDKERNELLTRYYHPYRARIRVLVVEQHRKFGTAVVHLSVHSFTPVLSGERRRADVGILYDPRRAGERQFASAWRHHLRLLRPDLLVRRNYPYLGHADGLTTALRREFAEQNYRGLELEVNQRWPRRGGSAWLRLQQDLVKSFSAAHGRG